MPHSSQVASCGCAPEELRPGDRPLPVLALAFISGQSPGGGNGLSPDQYQLIARLGQRIPEGRGLVRYCPAVSRGQLTGPQPADALDQPEHHDGEHGRPHQQRNPRGDHVREVDLALRPRQGVGRVAGHRPDQVRHPDLRAEQDGVQHAEPQHQRDPGTADQGPLAAAQAEQHGDQRHGHHRRDRQRRPAGHAGHPRQFGRPGARPPGCSQANSGRDQGDSRREPGSGPAEAAGRVARRRYPCRGRLEIARRRQGRRSRPRGRP